jgi:hypothetical protein
MYELLSQAEGDVLGVRVSDTVTGGDYERLVTYLRKRHPNTGILRSEVLTRTPIERMSRCLILSCPISQRYRTTHPIF